MDLAEIPKEEIKWNAKLSPVNLLKVRKKGILVRKKKIENK